MDISDKIYDILVREVDRLDIKQRSEGLSRDDVAILSTLTSTAVSIKRATPEKKDPVEDMAYEDLMNAALAPLREQHERTETISSEPADSPATGNEQEPQPKDEAGDTSPAAKESPATAKPAKPHRGHGKGGSQ